MSAVDETLTDEPQDALRALNRQRGSLRARLTRFQSFLSSSSEKIDIQTLKAKLDQIKDAFKTFDKVQTTIETIVDDAYVENEYEARGDFEDLIIQAITNAERIIREKEPQPIVTNQNFVVRNETDSQLATAPSPLTVTSESHVKLPTMHLPQFSGSYEEWPGFSDTFKSAVHENQAFRDTQKLIYLRSCLIGRAAEKIESLDTTAANYSVAWSILETYYDDPAAVINNRIKAFFELPNCTKGSSNELGEIVDSASKHFHALKALKKPFLDAFPIYAVVSKLDEQTRLKWKEKTQGNETMPKMEELLEFLHNRRKILETVCKVSDSPKNNARANHQNRNANQRLHAHKNANNPTMSYAARFKAVCHLCKGEHFTQNCEKLVNAEIHERNEIIKQANLCFNCLKSNHSVSNCLSSRCKECNGKHHTLLHRPKEISQPIKANAVTVNANVCSDDDVILATAIVHMLDKQGNRHACRVLLDAGSQSNFITYEFANKLKLQRELFEIPVEGINNMNSCINERTNATIESRFNKFSADLTFLLVECVSARLPSNRINRKRLSIPSNIRLADSDFDKSAPVDALIGARLFYKLLNVGRMSLNNEAVLQKTVFGWIVAGPISSKETPKKTICNLSMNLLHSQVQKFWEIEEGPRKSIMSEEENAAELHFRENHTRDSETGQYTVKLPFKENKDQLAGSYPSTLKRFYSLERSLNKNEHMKSQYVEFMREYETLHHMTEKSDASLFNGYFLPHHPVIKESSLTTKLRVVFDASAKTASGLSLNDTLMIGPTIQDDLFSLLVRFRSHVCVFTADIAKMYRMIKVHPDDRKYQRILWRESPAEPIRIFELNTVTYGTSASSFLATRVLAQLADDEADSFPRASVVLKEDLYVDDLLSGANTLDEAKIIVAELIQLARKGGLTLRQWASNQPSLIKSLPDCAESTHLRLDLGSTTKTLGIHWNPLEDTLTYSVNQPEAKQITKRTILSEIAQLFDPLGLLGPILVSAKILMQSLWQLGTGWDESLPTDIHTAWLKYRDQLPLIHKVKINRNVILENRVSLQLHGFSDASERAYGACIYIRSRDKYECSYAHLICSKSRVAPLKSISLPRLELCAALLLSNLYEGTIKALRRITFEKTVFWSDSTITLSWISTPPHTLKTFVANRVSEIQKLTAPHEWRHVSSEQNPADLISRGLTVNELLNNDLWFNGPSWLTEFDVNWPQSKFEIVEIPERRPIVINAAITTKDSLNLFNKFSSFAKLIRVAAYCWRFYHRISKNEKFEVDLSIDELEHATNSIIKLLQREVFCEELNALKSGKPIKGKLAPLTPFLDSRGVLRVGGRLANADLPYHEKHPALLPRKHDLTTLIIREQHIRDYHAGAQATLYSIRKRYWIIDGRNAVKHVIHKCIVCCRANPKTPNYLMGNLPKNRLVYKRPFLQTGIDYCGPFYIKEKRHRNRNKVKVYVAIFICFATKAVHIEVVSDLTTEAFLAALKRFFARRGKSSDLHSDNATNFQGAKHEIDEIFSFLQSAEHNKVVSQFLTNERVKWHFIPPRSPHFGGLWEASVKSLKHHMRRVIGDALLTFEALSTYVIEIEAILNSRPLTPLSSDPNDLTALTPAHFLIGDSLTSLPERNLEGISTNRLSSWQHVQQLRQCFWTRWHKEYLHEQTVRKKWHTGATTSINVGDLVILQEDNTPPWRWNLGRVVAIHPGADGIVRTATVRTVLGEYKRSIKKLSPLPIDVN